MCLYLLSGSNRDDGLVLCSHRRPSTLGIVRGQIFVCDFVKFIVAVGRCLGFMSIVEVEWIS